MDDNVSECAVTVRKGSASGTVVYNGPTVSHFVAPAARIVPGLSSPARREYAFPIHVFNTFPGTSAARTNDIVFSDGTYFWNVTIYNRLNNSATSSEWRSFDVVSSAIPDGVNLKIKYDNLFGVMRKISDGSQVSVSALTNSTCIRVQAFKNGGFAGMPEAEVTINSTDYYAGRDGDGFYPVFLRGLEKGSDYYVRAYIDCNNSRTRDDWEPYGYACYTGVPVPPLRINDDVVPVRSGAGDPESVIIVDADTDGDGVSDGAEYVITGGSGNLLGVYGAP